MTPERIRLGISACLLGEPVRFDGGHKRDPFLAESLGPFVDLAPVCPEVESGLDAPSESMRLVQADGRIRLNDPRLRENFVERVLAYRRLTAPFAARWSMGDVVRFHTAHKVTLVAHRPEANQRLGRLVASGKSTARRAFQATIRPNS
jgi:2-thiouracil desulfurase